MHHKTADTPKTAGRVIHRGARWYDLFGTVISFGRDKAIREKLIELAEPAPGEKVLDVGCGTGALALILPDDVKAKGFLEIRRVLKPGGRFMAMDFAAPSHSPLSHLLSIFGHSHGENVVGKLVPMLEEAGFSDVEGITTQHKNFAFVCATRDREGHTHG